MAGSRNRRKQNKAERRKSRNNTKIKITEQYKRIKSIPGAIQYFAKFVPKLSKKTDRLRKLLKKYELGKWGEKQERVFNQKKNIGATACRAWARAETFNGLQKVLQILCVPGLTTL